MRQTNSCLLIIVGCVLIGLTKVSSEDTQGETTSSNSQERDECVSKSAAYIAKATAAGGPAHNLEQSPVQTLISVSRQFYPTIIELTEAELPSREYTQAVTDVGPQLGCAEIDNYIQQLIVQVPCYEELLELDENAQLDISKADEAAGNVLEAYLACKFSDD